MAATTTKAKAPRRQTRKPAAAKAAPAKADARMIDRVPAEQFRALVADLGLTHGEVAEAVGRSTTLVRGWLGHTGQMRPAGKEGGRERPTNPLLARARLGEVTAALRAFAKQKAKGGAKAAAEGRGVVLPIRPPAEGAEAHGAERRPPPVPQVLVDKRRRERAEREQRIAAKKP